MPGKPVAREQLANAMKSTRPRTGGKPKRDEAKGSDKRMTLVLSPSEDKALDTLTLEVGVALGRMVNRSDVLRALIAGGDPKKVAKEIVAAQTAAPIRGR